MKYFYLFSFVVALVFIQGICEIERTNDDVKISYCYNFDYKNLPLTCQKMVEENMKYNTAPFDVLWRDVYKKYGY